MSFSRISYFALALAAGLAAPASAATTQWNIVFTASTDFGGLAGGGGGNFTVEEPAGNGILVPLSSWLFNFTLYDSNGDPVVNDLTLTEGTPTLVSSGPNFAFRTNGTPYLQMNTEFADGKGISLGGGDIFGNIFQFSAPTACVEEPIDDEPIEVFSFDAEDPPTVDECDLIWQGTYTLARIGDPEPPVIPLPATAALLPLGLVALGALRRRKAKA